MFLPPPTARAMGEMSKGEPTWMVGMAEKEGSVVAGGRRRKSRQERERLLEVGGVYRVRRAGTAGGEEESAEGSREVVVLQAEGSVGSGSVGGGEPSGSKDVLGTKVALQPMKIPVPLPGAGIRMLET